MAGKKWIVKRLGQNGYRGYQQEFTKEKDARKLANNLAKRVRQNPEGALGQTISQVSLISPQGKEEVLYRGK